MNRGLALFLARLVSNKHKDLFITRLGVTLLLGKFGITGRLAEFLSIFLRSFLGLLLEVGIFHIDLVIDSYREGQKLKEFEAGAKKAYEKTISKVHDEEKKNEIRLEYLRLIRLIGPVGNPK